MSGQLRGFVGGTITAGWRKLRADILTHVLKVISYVHSEIHGGSAYRAFQSVGTDAFDIATPLTYWFTTPNTTKWAHLVWRAACTSEALLEIFQDNGTAAHFDISAGDAVVPKNRNHNSANTSDMTFKSGVTVTKAEANVLIYSEYIGSRKSEGDDSGGRLEDILKQNTEYLFLFTSVGDNNEGSLGLDWYEHTNKT
jgi:hypothetical protein